MKTPSLSETLCQGWVTAVCPKVKNSSIICENTLIERDFMPRLGNCRVYFGKNSSIICENTHIARDFMPRLGNCRLKVNQAKYWSEMWGTLVVTILSWKNWKFLKNSVNVTDSSLIERKFYVLGNCRPIVMGNCRVREILTSTNFSVNFWLCEKAIAQYWAKKIRSIRYSLNPGPTNQIRSSFLSHRHSLFFTHFASLSLLKAHTHAMLHRWNDRWV